MIRDGLLDVARCFLTFLLVLAGVWPKTSDSQSPQINREGFTCSTQFNDSFVYVICIPLLYLCLLVVCIVIV